MRLSHIDVHREGLLEQMISIMLGCMAHRRAGSQVLFCDERVCPMTEASEERKLTRKEFAREMRRAAYQRAKEQRANDPKQQALKEAMKQRRKQAYQDAKARRAADPKQIELKEAMKQRRKEASEAAKERRRAMKGEQRQKERASKDRNLLQLVLIPGGKED